MNLGNLDQLFLYLTLRKKVCVWLFHILAFFLLIRYSINEKWKEKFGVSDCLSARDKKQSSRAKIKAIFHVFKLRLPTLENGLFCGWVVSKKKATFKVSKKLTLIFLAVCRGDFHFSVRQNGLCVAIFLGNLRRLAFQFYHRKSRKVFARILMPPKYYA